MSFVIEVSKKVTVKQGLLSPVKAKVAKETKTDKQPIREFEIVVRAGVAFADKQLKKSGWFVDSDAFEQELQKRVDYLASDVWTTLFDFRPTFELVSQWLANELKPHVKQLEYVELENKTLGVVTQYIP